MYVQASLKKRKTGKSALEGRAGTVVKEMKSEDIVDENELVTYFVLSNEGMTTVSNLSKAAIPSYSMYDAHFINSAEEHEFGVGVEMCGKGACSGGDTVQRTDGSK